MPVPKFFKTEFDALATDNAIGHPDGELAYGYLRVSSAGQADEGRSGLPRQMMNVHEAAMKYGLRIPWEYLFADDDSGFEFADRPDLSRLRQEYKSTRRRANAVVIEHLDRLSRNADWHQGYLLDEMKQYGLQSIFWKEFTSRIERAVMGAIAQDGMEQAKQRMAEGNIHKAKSGRVTARTPAYGYKLVDSKGHEGETAKKDTHYAIKDDEAHVVQFIFRQAMDGRTLRGIARVLEENYPPPKRYSYWDSKMVALIIGNPVYKGEYIAHTRKEIKVPISAGPASLTGGAVKTITRRVARPPEEWIVVPVPPIVTVEEWELANKVLEKNKQMSRRNGKAAFLLTGLIHCATCNYKYSGGRRKYSGKKGTRYGTSWYRCSAGNSSYAAIRERAGCDQSQVSTKVVDEAVWSLVYQVLLDPQILIDALEREFQGERNDQTSRQIAYLENQINASNLEDEKLYKAYLAGVFDETEYAARRSLVRENRQKLTVELQQLNGSLISPEKFEERRQEILMVCEHARTNGLAQSAPFEVKRNIIKTIVERIVLNVNEGWFEMEGVITGRYFLYEDGDAHLRNNSEKSG